MFYIKDDKRYEKDTLNGTNIFREIRKTLEKENIVLNTKQDSEILHLIKTDFRIEEDKNKNTLLLLEMDGVYIETNF